MKKLLLLIKKTINKNNQFTTLSLKNVYYC